MKSFSCKIIIFFSLSLICAICSALSQTGYNPIVQGSGKLIRDTIQIPTIKKLHITGIANLHIQHAQHNTLIVEAEDNILPTLKHEIKGNTLYIGLKNNLISPTHPITYTLKIKDLSIIQAYDNTKIICRNGLKLDTLSIAMFNNAFANLWFNGNKFMAQINNSANLTIGGFAKQQEIIIKEAGIFNGKQLRGSNETNALKTS